jgi:hypothetical protein
MPKFVDSHHQFSVNYQKTVLSFHLFYTFFSFSIFHSSLFCCLSSAYYAGVLSRTKNLKTFDEMLLKHFEGTAETVRQIFCNVVTVDPSLSPKIIKEFSQLSATNFTRGVVKEQPSPKQSKVERNSSNENITQTPPQSPSPTPQKASVIGN